MKEYPSIQNTIVDQDIYAFDKLDGSNVRAEWSRKNGFYKFGKRHGLVDETDPLLGEAKGLILNTYAETLSKIFTDLRWKGAVCYFEYFGMNSFAGSHADEPHQVVLFDIVADKRGILTPHEFLKLCSDTVSHAPLLYRGKPNEPFIESVKDGSLEGMTFEGVVCKGPNVSPGRPLMFKVKNQAWIDKVKGKCDGDEELLKKLL